MVLGVLPPCEALNISLAVLSWHLILVGVASASLPLTLVTRLLGVRLVALDGRLRPRCEYFAQICVVLVNILVFLGQ